jgi:hypothetical protein
MAWKDHLASPAAVAVIAGVSAAIGAVAGPYLTSRVEYFTRNREMDIKMVEIAVGILRADDKKEPGVAPARAWAADVIDRYSQVPLSAEARKSLIEFGVRGSYSSFVDYSYPTIPAPPQGQK